MIKAKDNGEEGLDDSQSRELEEIQTRLSFIEETLRTQGQSRFSPLRFLDNRFSANVSVAVLGIVGAFVLGFAIYSLVKGFQWRGALSDLRAEPGLQVMSIRSTGLFKKQVIGMRDPLAPNPHKIIQKHNIPPSRVDFQLAEYHSLNTPYGRQRQLQQDKYLLDLRGKVIGVAGNLSEENRKLREDELGKMSQLLLEMRFPEAMRKLNLQYDDGVWHADGQLLTNEYEDFKAQAGKFILNGSVDLDKIGNYTQARSQKLIKGIESANLLDKDYAGEPAHVPRVARLIKEYDALAVSSGVTPGRIRLIIESNNPDAVDKDLQIIANKLSVQAGLSATRVRLMPPLPIKDKEVEDKVSIKVGG